MVSEGKRGRDLSRGTNEAGAIWVGNYVTFVLRGSDLSLPVGGSTDNLHWEVKHPSTKSSFPKVIVLGFSDFGVEQNLGR